MWVLKFETRMRKQNESLAEFGDGLAQRAYSDINHEVREIVSLKQLYKQLYKSLSYKCISKNCTSVTKVV